MNIVINNNPSSSRTVIERGQVASSRSRRIKKRIAVYALRMPCGCFGVSNLDVTVLWPLCYASQLRHVINYHHSSLYKQSAT